MKERFRFERKTMIRLLCRGGAALLASIVWSCTSQQSDSKMQSSQNAETKMPTILVGTKKLEVEIVQSDEERMRGLMHREQLGENEGMLFVFEEAQIQSFWMRNTFIPLDIAFIDANGKIIDVQRMEPLDETKSYFSPAPVPYVLEVNAGWFERNGVTVGEIVKF